MANDNTGSQPPSSTATLQPAPANCTDGQKKPDAYITITCAHGKRQANSLTDNYFGVVPTAKEPYPYEEEITCEFHGDTSLKGKLFSENDPPNPSFKGDGFGKVKVVANLNPTLADKADLLSNLFNKDKVRVWSLDNVPGKAFELRYYDNAYYKLTIKLPPFKSFKSGRKLEKDYKGKVTQSTEQETKQFNSVKSAESTETVTNKRTGDSSISASETRDNVKNTFGVETKGDTTTILHSQDHVNEGKGFGSTDSIAVTTNADGTTQTVRSSNVRAPGYSDTVSKQDGSSVSTQEIKTSAGTKTTVTDLKTGESLDEDKKNGAWQNAKAGKTSVQQSDVAKTVLGSDKPVSLERNGQPARVDVISVIGSAINLFNGFMGLADTIKNIVPSIGFYIDLKAQFFQGEVYVAWGWKEYTDARTYYKIEGGGKLKLLDLKAEVGVGIKAGGAKAQIYANIQGSATADLNIAVKDPDGHISGSLNIPGEISIHVGIRADVSTAAKATADIKSGVEMKLAIVLDPKFGISGPINFTGIEGTLCVSVLGGLFNKNCSEKWMPAHFIHQVDWPTEKKIASSAPLGNKEIFDILKAMIDGQVYRDDFGETETYRKLFFYHTPPSEAQWETRGNMNSIFTNKEYQLDFHKIDYSKVLNYEDWYYEDAIKQQDQLKIELWNQVTSTVVALDLLFAFEGTSVGNLKRDSATIYAYARWVRDKFDDMVNKPEFFTWKDGFNTDGFITASSTRYKAFRQELKAYYAGIQDPAANFKANMDKKMK